MQALSRKTATIAATEAVSDAVEVRFESLVGVVMPAAWTAADLTLEVSYDGTAWNEFWPTTAAPWKVASAQAAAGRQYAISPLDSAGIAFVRVKSSVAQAADRLFTLLVRGC